MPMLLRPEGMNINKLSSICRFQSYEESEKGVEVTYTEAGEPKHIRCKLLVGADGYFSAVRQQCLEDGPPDFAVSPHLPMDLPLEVEARLACMKDANDSAHGWRSARACPWSL